LAEAERAKLEAERLAERALHMEEQQSMERSRSDSPLPKNGCSSRDSRIKTTRRPQQNEEDKASIEDVVADGGSDAGYQRYLLSYHQPSNAVNNDDGESARGEQDIELLSEEGESPSLQADEKRTTSAVALSKIRANRNRRERSVSHRSLSFSDVDETAMEEVKLTKDEPSLQHIKSLESVNLDDPKYMRSFLTKPCPKGLGTIECSIKRNKTIKNVLFPEYRMYLRSSDGGKTELCLMTSKKRAGSTTSNYLISMGRNDHDRSSENVIGKLRSNFLGTEYHIYDDGKNPEFDESHYDEKNDGGEITDRSEIRCELGAILYAASTTLGAKGPRKMSCVISKVDDYGNPLKVWQPMKKDDESISKFLKTEVGTKDKVVLLENKPPSWNNDVKAYVLNFNGRVTMASVKNFQLCTRDDDGKQIMQFGRVGDDEFNLDVQWPMSLLQAFSIALSSFDSKLGCD
jgi:tubby-related protein 1